MLLNKSQQINTIAWLPDAPPTVLPTAIYFSGSSEYNPNAIELIGEVISTQNTPYLITQISASYVPAASGWYLVDTYYADADLLTWDGSGIAWNDANYSWDSAGFVNTPIDTLRIFVSGSNDPQFITYVDANQTGSFTRYVSANENGVFNTYTSGNETGSYTRYYSANESGSFVRYVSSNERGYYVTKNN